MITRLSENDNICCSLETYTQTHKQFIIGTKSNDEMKLGSLLDSHVLLLMYKNTINRRATRSNTLFRWSATVSQIKHIMSRVSCYSAEGQRIHTKHAVAVSDPVHERKIHVHNSIVTDALLFNATASRHDFLDCSLYPLLRSDDPKHILK